MTSASRLKAVTRVAVLALLAVSLAGCGGSKSASGEGRVTIGKARQSSLVPAPRKKGSTVLPPGRIVEGEPPPSDLPPGPVPFGSAGVRCGGTTLEPRTGNLADVGRATLCLLNVERAVRGLRPLRPNPRLSRAARGHSRDMVTNAYFSHDSRSGEDYLARIRKTGYLQGARRWTAGENLAWGTDVLAQPAQIVRAWMQSPGHRANILYREYREVGLGIVLGVPLRGGESGATYSSTFGARL